MTTFWQAVTVTCGGVLWGETWIYLRDRARARGNR